jgi:SagB-type dehydrogenase family enzyme
VLPILEYHERTKHSVESVRTSRHFLDWEIQPRPFKLYRGPEAIPLPCELAPPDMGTLAALAGSVPESPRFVPDRSALAKLFYFSAGITKTKTYPGGLEMHFRAAACTGALYHIDLYLVAGELPDLEAGVYHFGAHDFALRRLRRGDRRSVVVQAAAGEPAVAAAPALLVCTSTFWRNSWKYQARTYRHAFWDAGTLLANLLAVAAAENVAARVVLGFVDDTLNRLLALDTEREVALAIVPIGRSEAGAATAAEIEPLAVETEPLSEREVDYPMIRAAHAATSFERAEQVQSWRRATWRPASASAGGDSLPLPPPAAAPLAKLGRTILRRGSSRTFERAPISVAALSTLLRAGSGPVPLDCLAGPEQASLNHVYLIVNAVDGLDPGTYALRPGSPSLEVLRRGDFRRQAGFLDLGQELAADASVNLYFLSDLDAVLGAFGQRGYRAAQLEAAILGGRAYLAAYGLGLGATGLTFFDDDVTNFFSPHAAGKSVMFLVAAGTPGKR